MNLIGSQLPKIDDLFHFGDNVVGGSSHHRVKIACRLAIGQVAPAVAPPSFDEREIATEGAFQDVWAAGEFAGLLALSDHGAVAGGRVEGRNTSTASPDALRKSALGIQ